MLWEVCFLDASEPVTDLTRQCPCFSTSLSPAQTSQALPQLEEAWKKLQAHARMRVRAALEEAPWLCSSYVLELGCVCDAIYWSCSPSDPSPPLPCCPGLLFRHFRTRAQMKAGWKAPGASMSRNRPLADFKGPVWTAKLQPARPSFSSSAIANPAVPAGERLAHM